MASKISSYISPLGVWRVVKSKVKKEKQKMSEPKVKSNAPWILGIIGLFLTIAHTACAVLCTAAISAGDETFGGASHEAAQETFNKGMSVASVGIAIMALCFILSFFGKSKASRFTGLLLVVGGLVAAGFSIAHFSAAGIAAGIIYFCAGISSICNRNKVKA